MLRKSKGARPYFCKKNTENGNRLKFPKETLLKRVNVENKKKEGIRYGKGN